MADEVQTPLNDGELGIMQPIYTPELAFVPDVGDGGEFQTFKKPSVYVPYVQYDSIESLTVYGSVEGVSSIYVNSHQYVLPIPKPLTAGDVWQSKVNSVWDERVLLDGTERWLVSSVVSGMFFIELEINPVTAPICSNFVYSKTATTEQGKFYITSNQIRFLTSYETLNEWKNFLIAQKEAGTPVTIYFQSTSYNGTNGLTVSVADYQGEIYANNFVDIFTDDGELWVDGGDFVEVAVNNIVLNGLTNDERAGEYGTPQIHTFH